MATKNKLQIRLRYICWYEDDFWGSPRVSRKLTWLQRHLYMRLCIAAMYCATAPYLPVEPDELALLADCPIEIWRENSDAVLSMFEKSEKGLTHPRMLRDYKLQTAAAKERVKQAKSAAKVRWNKDAPSMPPASSSMPPAFVSDAPDALTESKLKQTETKPTESQTEKQTNFKATETETRTKAKTQGQPSGSVATKNAGASQDGCLDGSDGRSQDSGSGSGGRVEREHGLKNARLLNDKYWSYEFEPGLVVGDHTTDDLMTWETLLSDWEFDTVYPCLIWMMEHSNHWAREGAGALKGVKGFTNAFKQILEQYQKYRRTIIERRKEQYAR